MNLRYKILTVYTVMFLLLLGIVFFSSRIIIGQRFESLEHNLARENMIRFMTFLHGETDVIARYNRDWSFWNDSMFFVESPEENEAYIHSNLQDNTFIEMKLNLIVLWNEDNEVVWNGKYDPAIGYQKTLSKKELSQIQEQKLIFDNKIDHTSKGLIQLAERIYIFSCTDILTSQKTGSSKGHFLMAQTFNKHNISSVSNYIHANIEAFEYSSPGLKEEIQHARMELRNSEEDLYFTPLSTDTYAGYGLLRDISGKPLYIIRAKFHRDVLSQGHASLRVFLYTLLLTGFGIGLILWLAIHRYLIQRIEQLAQEVLEIGQTKLISKRVASTGNDEISKLCNTINKMLHSLELSEEELKANEEKYRELTNKLANEQKKLQDMINFLPDATFVINQDKRIIAWNHAMEELTGIKRQDMLGKGNYIYAIPFYHEKKPLLIDCIFSAENCETITNKYSVFQQSGSTLYAEEYVPYIRHGKGAFLSYTASPLEDSEQELTGAILSIRDITAQQEYARELKRAKEIAESSSKAKSQFLSQMSHEIRTPMNAIIGLTRLVQLTTLTKRQDDYVGKIGRAAANLLDIINNILDFSKIEAGKMGLDEADFDLYQLLDDLADILNEKAGQKGLELMFQIDSSVPEILYGDELRLRQILTNLLNNAIKFTEFGEVSLQIKPMKKSNDKLLLEFQVKDSGIGMPDEKIAEVFESFTQADQSVARRYGGTGLGLPITQKLTILMKGKVSVTSKPGQGSTFTCLIPFKQPKNTQEQFMDLPSEIKNKKILVIDDNPHCLDILTGLLNQTGCAYTCIQGGDLALKSIESDSKYDMYIIDMNMPGKTGLQTAQEIHAKTQSEIPVLFLCSHSREVEVTTPFVRKQDRIILKPVLYPNLMNQILSMLGYPQYCKESMTSDNSAKMAFKNQAFKGYKILLAEDNLINQQVAIEILESAGLSVVTAKNGLDAVQKVQDDNFHLILMDIQMPEMDGHTALKMIRLIPNQKHIPIIAMTAFAMKGEQEKYLREGFNDYVTKPFSPDHLFSTIRKWLPEKHGLKLPTNLKQFMEKTSEQKNFSLKLNGFNTESALKRVGGNLSFYKRLLHDFAQEYKPFSLKLRTTISKGDFATANNYAHTMKGLAGNLGAVYLEKTASQLEDILINKEYHLLQTIVDKFEQELESAIKAIATIEKNVSEKKDDKLHSPEKIGQLIEDLKAKLTDCSIDSENIFDTLYKGLKKQQKTLVEPIRTAIFKMDYPRALLIIKEIENTIL